jgi:hypothetical protein
MEKEKLKQLINERKEKFDTYFSSIEKRSGIFGNKTKKDLLQSNKVLVEIVKTDNNIISVLNRALDFKSFEKTNFNYDKLEQDRKIQELSINNDRLLIELKSAKEKEMDMNGSNILLKITALIEFFLLAFIFYSNYKRRKLKTQ